VKKYFQDPMLQIPKICILLSAATKNEKRICELDLGQDGRGILKKAKQKGERHEKFRKADCWELFSGYVLSIGLWLP
jgi:hypothetical protein